MKAGKEKIGNGRKAGCEVYEVGQLERYWRRGCHKNGEKLKRMQTRQRGGRYGSKGSDRERLKRDR